MYLAGFILYFLQLPFDGLTHRSTYVTYGTLQRSDILSDDVHVQFYSVFGSHVLLEAGHLTSHCANPDLRFPIVCQKSGDVLATDSFAEFKCLELRKCFTDFFPQHRNLRSRIARV